MMNGYIVLLSCLLLCKSVTSQFSGQQQFSLTKDPRFILFLPSNFLNFDQPECKNGRTGTCTSALTCILTKGTMAGFCDGFGIKTCCEYEIVGSGTLRSKNGVWVNSDPPRRSTLEIVKATSKYSQVRIDIKKLSLDGPKEDSVCDESKITFSEQENPPAFELCGDLSDQHVYLNFGPTQNIVITIEPSEKYEWEITITQLRPQDSPLFAPSDCLQYFTEETGIIKSFNYGKSTETTRQIANLDYKVCVSNQKNEYCSIALDAEGEAFSLTGTADTPADVCETDYIEFGGETYSKEGDAVPKLQNIYCGGTFPSNGIKNTNGIATSNAFRMLVITDKDETDDTQNVGFHLKYTVDTDCKINE